MYVPFTNKRICIPFRTSSHPIYCFLSRYNMGILEGEVDMMGINTYYCNDMTSIRATRGGYADILVELEEDVEEGQVVATQFNAFGDVRANYTAPWAGRVLSIGTDPIREPGALMVRLCRQLEPEERSASP